VTSSGCTDLFVFTAVFTAGGTCNSITGLGSPVNFLASGNDYFAEDDSIETNQPSLSVTSSDLFTFGGSGLLTIGTLGIAVPGDDEEDDYSDVDVDANNNDATTEENDDADGAATPTFTYPPPPEPAAIEKVEAIAEKDDETTTEDDLMVVSAELEKVLGARNSGAAGELVASARLSFATGVNCPLQGFLFGSPVSDVESRQERRDSAGVGRRTSLGELFLRTRFLDAEGEDGKADGEEGRAGKGDDGGKVIKKDEKSACGDGPPASATKSKFQKVCLAYLPIFIVFIYLSKTYMHGFTNS
jgi:hypothetical protein